MKKRLTLIFIFLLIGLTLINIYIPHVKAIPSITYAFPTITVTGFTTQTPCTYWDLWNASNSNGWGVMRKIGTVSYDLWVDIVLGDGSTPTYFADTNVNVFFNTTYAGTRDRMLVMNNANLTLGILADSVTKRTTDGVNIIADVSSGGGIIDVDAGGIVELYGSHLTTLGADYMEIAGNLTIYESILTNIAFSGIGVSTNIDAYRVITEGGVTAIGNPTAKTIFDELLIHSYTNVIGISGALSPTFTNLVARNTTKIAQTFVFSGDLYLVDADVDNWAFTWMISPNGEVHRQYSFDLLVTYPNGTAINGIETGARVVIQHYGEGGGIDYNATLNENGMINQIALTMGIYKQSSGDTLNSYNPYNIHIFNVSGFNEYNGNLTLNIKQDLTLSLCPSVDLTLPIALLISFGVICILLVIACIKRKR